MRIAISTFGKVDWRSSECSNMAKEDSVSLDLAKSTSWIISSANSPYCKSAEYIFAIEIAYSLILVSINVVKISDNFNPLDARRRYTGFAQTSHRRQTPVYRRHGISTPPPISSIPAARYINATGQNPVYRLCFLTHTGTGMPES